MKEITLSAGGKYPAVVDMEKYLLGCMMIGDSRATCATVFAKLDATDFFAPANQLLFGAIKKIYSANEEPGTLNVFEELRKMGKLDAVGFNYLTSLPALINTDAYVETYANYVKETSNRRKIMVLAQKIMAGAQEGVNTVDELQQDFVDAMAELNAKAGDRIYSSHKRLTTQAMVKADDNEKYAGRKTGFYNIDAHHANFEPAVYVLGAIPGAGKTTFCWQMAEQLALQGETVLYFTYEIDWDKLWMKSIARRFRNMHFPPSVSKILNAHEDSALQEGAYHEGLEFESELEKAGGELVIIEADSTYSSEKIINMTRTYCRPGKKAPVVFVDYLQKVAHDREITRDGIDKTIRAFKDFQRKSEVTFVLITSYNRMNYRQTVALESSKESGGVDYEADVVWGMQLNVMNTIKGGEPESNIRKKHDDAMKLNPREINLKCLKNRNGEPYDAYFKYYCVSSHFEPVDNFDQENCDEDYDSMPF